MDFDSMFPVEAPVPAEMPQSGPNAFEFQANGIPLPKAQRQTQQQRQRQRRKRQARPPAAAAAAAASQKPKKPKAAPLPATVEVHGYEIMIPTTKVCWRVRVVHACGHPVIDAAGAARPLVIEVNRHTRPCGHKCKSEGLDHVVDGLCPACSTQRKVEHEQEGAAAEAVMACQGGGQARGSAGVGMGGTDLPWHGFIQF